MTRRTSRFNMPPDPASVFQDSSVYHSVAIVMAAVDAMATLLTGDPEYLGVRR